MGDETSDTMNLDLNLSPVPEPLSGSASNECVNLDDWVPEPIHRGRQGWRRWPQVQIPPEIQNMLMEVNQLMVNSGDVNLGDWVPEPINRARQGWRRWPQVQIPPETQNMSMEVNQLMVNSGDVSTLQMGEGSVPAEGRMNEIPNTWENNNGILEVETSEKNDDDEKRNGNGKSFFNCNICLDVARDPVLTCCGHLFCWPCLYRWLHVHSDAKECPVCNGEVTIQSVIPIYGHRNNIREPDEDSSLKIPSRPQARRLESLRQTLQRTAFTYPVEEMIPHLGSRSDWTQNFIQPQEPDSAQETVERTNSLLNRIWTSQVRREQILVASLMM